MQSYPPVLSLIVVDDDEQIRQAFGRLLRSYGHHVRAFESAEAFLAQDAAADCAILDVGLPGISGLELEERLRTPHGRIPIVFVTGSNERAVLAAVQRTGCQVLQKPVEEEGLLEAIARAVSTASGSIPQ